jgi:hypothetical protein
VRPAAIRRDVLVQLAGRVLRTIRTGRAIRVSHLRQATLAT